MKAIKIYTLFAGVNGAGKSTLYQADGSLNLGVRLNSDDVVRSLGADWRDLKSQIEAGRIILDKQRDCFEKGLSLNQETTLCGAAIMNAIKKAKELGYVINLNYVGVENFEIAKQRVIKRVALGGHGVSDETIERRYEVSMQNLIKVYPLCDKFKIYDNSGEGLQLVAYLANNELVRTHYNCSWVDNLIKMLK